MDNTYTINEVSQIIDMVNLVTSNKMTADTINRFLEKLFSLFFFDKASIYFYSKEGAHFIQTDSVDYNVTSDYIDTTEYYDKYSVYDDLFSSISMPDFTSFRFSDYYNFEARMSNPAWREFYIPSNIYFGINANLLMRSNNGTRAGLCLYRERSRNDFTLRDLELVRFFQPYLSKSLDYYGENLSDNETVNLSDHIGYAVFDKQCRLISSSGSYDKMILDDSLHHSIESVCRNARDNYLYNTGHSSVHFSDDLHYYIKEKISEYPGSSDPVIDILVEDYHMLISACSDHLRQEYSLSQRESNVLDLILKGLTNSQIANELYISIPSVKKHTASIYSKLGVNSNRQLIALIAGNRP